MEKEHDEEELLDDIQIKLRSEREGVEPCPVTGELPLDVQDYLKSQAWRPCIACTLDNLFALPSDEEEKEETEENKDRKVEEEVEEEENEEEDEEEGKPK